VIVHTRFLAPPLAVALLLLAPSGRHGTAHAQRAVTRAEALRAALAAGPRVAMARADSALARAALITARALPNPSLSASHSGAPPQKHLVVDVPFDAPWQRGPRIGAANAAARSARLRFLSERAAALLEVDTTYSTALGAHARFRLSRQTARDADSLRKMTVSRRNAGDASDLDVDLATVTAGQQENVAASDSLSFMSALLTVQTLMGIPADSIAIVLADTLRLAPADTRALLDATDSAAVLTSPPATSTSAITMPSSTPTAARTGGSSAITTTPATPSSPTPSGASTGSAAAASAPGASAASATPSIAAAEANLAATELAIARERRSVFGITSFQVGVEWGDPTTDPPDNERLWLFGVTIPLPFFNQNQGAIAQATAERDRARAELAGLRLETRQRIVESYRELASLRARVARDQDLVVRAERVAAKSMTAYREGASALPAVLEARRTAREVLGQYIDDLTALIILQSELRVLTGTAPQP
jgi:cobalt-zinc-cadmium efflux system outer membrane protein